MTDANEPAVVYVVDDDAGVRHAVGALLESVGQPCEVFATPTEFLERYTVDRPGCLVSDIRMPGMDGLELQRQLAKQGDSPPIVFITGHGDIPMAVQAMQMGAVSFIQKPFRDQELLDCIKLALSRDHEARSQAAAARDAVSRFSRLTGREHEVMRLVVAGKPNKVIAYELGLSQRTVEIHRARVMEKSGAQSLAELVRLHLMCADDLPAADR